MIIYGGPAVHLRGGHEGRALPCIHILSKTNRESTLIASSHRAAILQKHEGTSPQREGTIVHLGLQYFD